MSDTNSIAGFIQSLPENCQPIGSQGRHGNETSNEDVQFQAVPHWTALSRIHSGMAEFESNRAFISRAREVSRIVREASAVSRCVQHVLYSVP